MRLKEQTITYSINGRTYSIKEDELKAKYQSIKSLFEDNHKETGVYNMDFDPDYARYFGLEEYGLLKFITLNFEDKVVGCAVFFIDESIQQRGVIMATQSVNYIDKKHRGIGYQFMNFCDDILKKRGVNSVWRQATTKLDVGPVYERMGYELVEKSYLRRL